MSNDIDGYALGTNYFSGGMTYMNEKGWELRELPRGSKIYNHEASERYVQRSAEALVKGLLDKFEGNFGGGVGTVIFNLEGKEVARVSAPFLDNVQGSNLAYAERGVGL